MLWLLPNWINKVKVKKVNQQVELLFQEKTPTQITLISNNINTRLALRYKSSGSNCAEYSHNNYYS